jgi:hypothetical protein
VEIRDQKSRLEAFAEDAPIARGSADPHVDVSEVTWPSQTEVRRYAEHHAEDGLPFRTANECRPVELRLGDFEPATAKAAPAGEAARVEAAHHIELVAKLVVRLAPDTDAALSPGRRDDHAVDRRALDTVEDRRLVPLVDDAHRHQDRTGSQVERLTRTLEQSPVDEGLLDLHGSGNRHTTAFRDEGMFELDFGVELEAIVEAVREEDDEAMKVQDGAEAVVLGLHHV